MQTSNLTHLSATQLRKAADIQEKLEALTEVLEALLSGGVVDYGNGMSESTPAPAPRGKHVRSPEAKARMAASQRLRWAKIRGESIDAPAPAHVRKKRKLSPEGRANIIAATKARWAKARGETVPAAAPKAPIASTGKRTMSPAAKARIAAAARRRWRLAKAAGRTSL